ncbi:MAG: phosphoglycerate dehydrogenase [Planctomycetes bacterium]|nr:phosphoglycerate dehydrogenase [Planctomycetota bacterium]
MKKVLVADKVAPECMEILEKAGLDIEFKPGLSEEELMEAIRGVHGVICRSGARLNAGVLEAADNLEAICRAGVGVDNIDVDTASKKGIVVMNTPGGNTISTAEHAFALMLALARNIGPAYVSMREGRWDKKKFIGSQLAGSTLGIVGLGRIGRSVTKRALAFGMTVLAYDPYLSHETAAKTGAELVDNMEDLLSRVDYLTVHVPENSQTDGLIGAAEIALMKNDARVINCARGSIVDQQAVLDAIEAGLLGGAAFDVYVHEPPDDYQFAASDRVLATPHLGASTEEAQIAVATQAAEQMVDALQRQYFRNALNVSPVPPEDMKVLEPYCELAASLGLLVAQLNRGRPESIEVSCRGDIAQRNIDPIVTYGAVGVLRHMLGSTVNMVSASYVAEERGIHVTSSSTMGQDAGFTDLVEVKLVSDVGAIQAAGTIFGRKYPRIVRIGDYYVEVIPAGHILVTYAEDVPGLIGSVGSILAEGCVNIARMGFGREEAGGSAILALNLDSAPDEETIQRIRDVDVVREVMLVRL